MPVDNAMYDRLGWWDDDTPLAGLRTGINPARFGYFRGVLVDRLGVDPNGLRALDIGCGGGLLAEEFARLGCRVTGVDPSEQSIAAGKPEEATGAAAADCGATHEAVPQDEARAETSLRGRSSATRRPRDTNASIRSFG